MDEEKIQTRLSMEEDIEMSTFAVSIDFKLRNQLRSVLESEKFQALKIDYDNCTTIQPSIHIWNFFKLVEANLDMFPADCAKLLTSEPPNHTNFKQWRNPYCLSENLLICFYQTACEILYYLITHKSFLNFDLLFKTCLQSNNIETENNALPTDLTVYLQTLESLDNTFANRIDYIFTKELLDSIVLQNTLSSTLTYYKLKMDDIMEFYDNNPGMGDKKTFFMESLNLQLLLSLLVKFYPKINPKLPALIEANLHSDHTLGISKIIEIIRNHTVEFDDSIELEKANMKLNLFNKDNTLVEPFSFYDESSYLSRSSIKNNDFIQNDILDSSIFKEPSARNSFIISEPQNKQLNIPKRLSSLNGSNNHNHSAMSNINSANTSFREREDTFADRSMNDSQIYTIADPMNSKVKSDKSILLYKKTVHNKTKYIHEQPINQQYNSEAPFCKHCGIPHHKAKHLFDNQDPANIIPENYNSYKSLIHLYQPEGHMETIKAYEKSLKR